MKKIIVKIINDVLEEKGIKVKKIILFGSRAKGDFKQDSDWDLMIVTDRNLSFLKKRKMISKPVMMSF